MLKERLYIPLEDEWVTCVYYDRMWNRIFAACGTNLYVFDFDNGERLDNYYDIHELSITSIVFYEPFEYLITGGKDGSIKVRNAKKFLMYDFHEHFNAITGLLLLESVCEATRGSLPLLISSCLDSTIRMWNFETGQSLYRLDVSEPCLGMGWMKKGMFYHYNSSAIQLWNVNRYQHTFAFYRSKPLFLRRVQFKDKCPRLLTATSDGSIKLLSPVTGFTLATGFPSHTESTIRYVAYNMKSEIIYCLSTNDEIMVYDASTNPFKLIKIHSAATSTHEPYSVAVEADFYNYLLGSIQETDARLTLDGELVRDFMLFFGTQSGQLVYMDIANDFKECVLVQAHASQLDKLLYDQKRALLISSGQDQVIKVWAPKLAYEMAKLQSQADNNGLCFVTTIQCVSSINLQACDLNSIAFGICRSFGAVAVPFNGSILIGNYINDVSIQNNYSSDEQTVGKVTAIESLEAYGYWASVSTDNTVKIWDMKKRLLREIQFNESISSICVANRRGDLLVGLSDQISLVRIQDFLPAQVLKELVLNELEDDPIESAFVFDPELEFWNLQYEREIRSNGQVENWHIQKQQIQRHHTEKGHLEYLLNLPHQRRGILDQVVWLNVETQGKEVVFRRVTSLPALSQN